jgi:hypothetical protein
MAISAAQKPNIDEISRHAYMLYQERGCEPGHELEDWLKAEAILSSQGMNGNGSASNNGGKKTSQPPAKPAEIRAAKRLK